MKRRTLPKSGPARVPSQPPVPEPPAVLPARLAQLPMTLGLSTAQRLALTALAAGQTYTAAAALAGVDRSTLYRWQKIDPAYVAALNAWRDHTVHSARDRLLGAVEQAVTIVIDALVHGDTRTALTVLKSLGVLAPHTPGRVLASAARKAIERDGIVEMAELFRARAEAGQSVRKANSSPVAQAIFAHDRAVFAEEMGINPEKEQVCGKCCGAGRRIPPDNSDAPPVVEICDSCQGTGKTPINSNGQ